MRMPSIPPLFCSTPPPIDFEREEVEEDSNPPLGSLASKDSYDFENSELTDGVEGEQIFPSQSTNYDNRCFIESNSPPPLEIDKKNDDLQKSDEDNENCITSASIEHETASIKYVLENDKDYKLNDDTNAESTDPIQRLATNVLVEDDFKMRNIVTIEDLLEDSSDDERHSKQNLKNVALDVNSDDFCAIRAVEDVEKECDIIRKNTPVIDVTSTIYKYDNLQFCANFNHCPDPVPQTGLVNSLQQELNNEILVIDKAPKVEADATSMKTSTEPKTEIMAVNISDISEDDDDFGDFSAAACSNAAEFDVSYIKSGNNEETALKLPKLKFALEQIFPFDVNVIQNCVCSLQSERIINTLKLESIDHAKALEYQWTNSSMRHALIRSLGIDSRNILFGDHWNPSIPRFAANLSFNPLKPIKPELVTATIDSVSKQLPNVFGDNFSVHEVGFDCKQTSSVHPLSESQDDEHMQKNETFYVPQEPPGKQQKPHSSKSQNESSKADSNRFDNAVTLPTCNNNQTKRCFNMDKTLSEGVESLEEIVKDLKHSNKTKGVDEKTFCDNNIFNGLGASDDEVVTTSIYAGPLKETHIYTPSRSEAVVHKTTRSLFAVAGSVDFDYEKAAAGIIIDETVVKKEYRDVEYNPGFPVGEFNKSYKTETTTDATFITKTDASDDIDKFEADSATSVKNLNEKPESDCEDEFSEWQSSSAVSSKATIQSRTATPVVPDEMILSPAILLPQSISIGTNKPKIEWGDTATNINPEELARIEELFSQSRFSKAKDITSSQKPTPTHSVREYQLSISATIAQKEQHDVNDEEEDWSEFVSVPVAENKISTPQMAQPKMIFNGELQIMHDLAKKSSECSSKGLIPEKSLMGNFNDDEWSDFVSSAPSSTVSALQVPVAPQFNSAAWQNANFYNNPLSFYHQSHSNITNNNNNNNNNNNQYLSKNLPQETSQSQRFSQPQQIHMLQDFSTMAPYPTTRPNNTNTNIYQSAKVAPSVSLIPDLGFVAPSIPTHTAIFNTLPKPSFSAKK